GPSTRCRHCGRCGGGRAAPHRTRPRADPRPRCCRSPERGVVGRCDRRRLPRRGRAAARVGDPCHRARTCRAGGDPMSLLLLAGAIAAEVTATLSLRLAADGRRWFYLPVVAGYVLAFALLSAALAAGMPLGVALWIWSAVGVVASVLLSRLLFRGGLIPVMLAGRGLVGVRVLLVELGGVHSAAACTERARTSAVAAGCPVGGVGSPA